MNFKIVVLIALGLLASGCADIARMDATAGLRIDLGGYSVLVVKDPLEPVTCYITTSGTSCIYDKCAVIVPKPEGC